MQNSRIGERMEKSSDRMTPPSKGPDFVGVGVQKSGTSWLADVLMQHPEVWIPKKEINFFVRNYRKGYRWYENWFKERNGKIAGEFTPVYINSPRPDPAHREFYPRFNPRRALFFWLRETSARDALKKYYPNARIFAIFRNPIDRAWSAYWFWRSRKERLGKEVVPFERMWKEDGRWIRTTGLYGAYLSYWRKAFPDFRVFFYDDIRTAPVDLAQSVYRFIGADDAFVPKTTTWVNKGKYNPMKPETRKMLADYYKDEISAFSELTGRDLSFWLEIKPSDKKPHP